MKRKIVPYFFIFTTFAICSSCVGNRVANGYVKDLITNQPIDSVLVNVLRASEKTYTDTLGYYFAESPFGGCVPKCRDINIEFSKKGYKTIQITNPNQNEIIYLSPE